MSHGSEPKNKPNDTITYFGRKYRTDDNGDLYMSYNDEEKRWELLPNTKYVSNGYYYESDGNGSITNAGGTLRENIDGRKPLNAKVDGMQEGDDRGHVIGDQFDASNREDNLVPQLASVNRGEFRQFENTLAALRDEGHDIQVSYEPFYMDDPKRPALIQAHLNIDGYCFDQIFSNEEEELSEEDMAPAASGTEEEAEESAFDPEPAVSGPENSSEAGQEAFLDPEPSSGEEESADREQSAGEEQGIGW